MLLLLLLIEDSSTHLWHLSELLINEVGESGQVTGSTELDGLFLAQLEELQCGISGDLVRGAQFILLGAVHLADLHTGALLGVEEFRELGPCRGQSLAMSAPGVSGR